MRESKTTSTPYRNGSYLVLGPVALVDQGGREIEIKRPVIGFMSGNQQEPDMMCEVFILDPTDLVG